MIGQSSTDPETGDTECICDENSFSTDEMPDFTTLAPDQDALDQVCLTFWSLFYKRVYC